MNDDIERRITKGTKLLWPHMTGRYALKNQMFVVTSMCYRQNDVVIVIESDRLINGKKHSRKLSYTKSTPLPDLYYAGFIIYDRLSEEDKIMLKLGMDIEDVIDLDTVT